MGHGGETIVCSPQNHHSGNHHPQVGGPIPGGNKNHDKSKGSSKGSKKSQAHSNNQQTHSKPIVTGNKTRHGQGKVCSPNGNNKANLALQHSYSTPPPNMMKQHLLTLTNRQNKAVAPRQKSFSPPTLHPTPSSGNAKARTGSPVVQSASGNKDHFYAGARFETHPSHVGLPVPPSHWTAPLQRSQSQPSSPVPTSLPQKGVSVDLATLFGHSASADLAAKPASFPGERLMDALIKMEEERKKKESNAATVSFGSLTVNKAQVTNSAYEANNEETDELKKALGLAVFTLPVKVAAAAATVTVSNHVKVNSHLGSEMSPSKYQDISAQLKNLLKVAA